MGEVIIRLAVVAAVLALGLAAARAAGRFQQPVHPWVDLRSTNLEDRVVLFTSTDCSNCAVARRALEQAGVEFREVTWELEGAVQQRLGIDVVPLAVFRDAEGATVAQLAGAPRRRGLRRAIASMGESRRRG